MRAIISILLFISAFAHNSYAQLQVTANSNANELAQYLVGNGVVVSNAVLRAPGRNIQATGFFKNISSNPNLGIDSGIVFSTGLIDEIPGPYNRELSSSHGTGLVDDEDLQYSLVSSNSSNTNKYDRVSLEFDVKPLGDTLKFRYVFASSEYQYLAWVCGQYNDIFGFYINGPGINLPSGAPSFNIALIPNTNLPVSIRNVHNYNACLPNNSDFYVDNTSSDDIGFHGMTVVLTAKVAVQPCETYRLKLKICDVGDALYDSGIFLEAKSLSSNIPNRTYLMPFDTQSNTAYSVEGCNDATNSNIQFSLSEPKPIPTSIGLTYAGTATNGVDCQLLPSSITFPPGQTVVTIPFVPIVDNIDEGIEVLKIYFTDATSPCGISTPLDSAVVQIRDFQPLLTNPPDTAGVCLGQTANLQVFGTFSNFTWTPTSLFSGNTNQAFVTTNPIFANQTAYISANFLDCNARDSIKIMVKKLELESKKDILCVGGNEGEIRLKRNNYWSFPLQFALNNINGPYQSSNIFLGLTAGNYKVYAKDATNCIDSIEVNIMDGTAPNFVANVNNLRSANCFGLGGSFSISTVGGTAPFGYSENGIDYDSNNNFTAQLSGNKLIYVRDFNGCIKTLNFVLPKDDFIEVNEIVTPADCSGAPNGTLTLIPSLGSGNYPLYAVNGVTQNTNTFNLNTGIGQYVVYDDKGCFYTDTFEIKLQNNLFVEVGGPVSICEQENYTVNAVSNAINFSWIPNDGSIIGSSNLLNPTIKVSATKDYIITASQGVCDVKDTLKIVMLPAPTANAGNDKTICYGVTTTLTGSGGTQYQWTSNNPASIVSGANTSTLTVKPLTTSNYILTVTDANGCKSLTSDTVKITVTAPVAIKLVQDSSVAINQPIQLYAFDVNNSGINQWRWSPPNLFINPNVQNPLAKFTDFENLVTLTGTTPNGCIGFGEIMVKSYKGPDIYVPNAFSPNNDNLNDVLRIKPIGMKQFLYFALYDRWGKLIFRTSDYNLSWDGTYKGNLLNSGTYVWVAEAIDYRGNKFSKKGTVMIIR